MPDYRQKSTTRNYLSRREQWRILLMVMSLGLVVLLMSRAAEPKNWEWLWADVERQAEPSDTGQNSAGQNSAGQNSAGQNSAGQSEQVDTRFLLREEDLAPGVVRIVGKPPANKNTDDGDYFDGVHVEGLREVRDNVIYLHLPDEGDPERKVWFNLFKVLNRTDETTLRKASTEEVTFAQLFHDSSTYRGKLVTLKGYVHRALPRKPAKNDVGIEDYFELWVSVGREAMAVFCLQLPEGFPTGDHVSEEVEITGFYYKRLAFSHLPLEADKESKTGERPEMQMSLAPVLLAKTVHWKKKPREPAKTAAAPDARLLLAAGGASLVFALAFTWWVCVRNRRQSAAERVPNQLAPLEVPQPRESPSDVETAMKAAHEDQQ